jgi:NADH-quinone oxidoreductase subunit E
MSQENIDGIIDKYVGEPGVLIQLLLDIQREMNWIPKEAMERMSERLQIPLSEIYRAASFYKGMSLTPIGRHLVRVCLGTACQVRGGSRVMDKAQDLMAVKDGETTPDQRFTLKRVNCVGCCALGPVVVVGEEYHGKLSPAKVAEVLEQYQ